ncbi:hypothetical protein A0256_22550 [Mucilaginibacter sp. PAMC 26640]|nr:hypothetical protein A0256_22550 [Mucilaginibacter sp. PAMC 26640]
MKKLLLALIPVLYTAACFAQAPIVSYQSPQNYIVGTTINSLAPAKAGGAVPPAIYGQVATLAGSGVNGSTDGSGSLATFNDPKGLAADSKGNIYVADKANSVIRKITPEGLVSTFVPKSAGLSFPAGLAFDAGDNLYIADIGTNQVKKVTPAGAISIVAGTGDYGFAVGPALLSSFKSPSGIAIDGAGNIYVSDYGNQQIRKIAGGMVSVLAGTGATGYADGDKTVAKFNGPFGVATDAAGNVYVADIYNNAIRKVTPTGVVSTLAGNGTAGAANGTGTAARFEGPYGVANDANGNLYVSDSYNSLVRKITPAGVVTTLAGNAGNFGTVNAVGTDALFSFPVGIVADKDGNLYTADNGSSTIRKILLTGYNISPALPPGLSFDATTGIINGTPTAVSPAQDYTITAYNKSGSGSAIVNITTRLISTDATLSGLLTGGVSLSPSFSPSQRNYVMTVPETTTGINVTPSLADINATLKINGSPVASGAPFTMPLNTGGNSTAIQVIAEDGVTISTYTVSFIRPRKAVNPPNISYSSPQQYTVNVAIPPLSPQNTGGAVPARAYGGVTTVKSGLEDVSAIAVDPSGNIYVTNVVSNIIQKVSPGGNLSTFASGFSTPYGLAADAFGNIYVGDSGFNMIKKVSAAGEVSIVSGKSGDYNFANGDADLDAKYRYPVGVATDGSGNLYVADLANADIRKISITGRVTTLAGTNAAGSANNTNGSNASFNEPYAVATDLNGNVYVADSKNNKIRKITPSGATTTFAGSGAAGQTNGTGTLAAFESPKGVATDVLGNVYVLDAANSMIRKITPSGVTTRLAGSGYYLFTDGIGPLAAFSYPLGIAADADGQLYISDSNNKAIRKIQTTGYVISPATLPAGLTFDATTGKISGTPTASAGPANFTITAYNLGGSSSAIVNIRVNGLNNDATLKSLDLSSGTLSTAFSSGTLSYSTNNTGNADFITLTPTSTQGSASIKINGATVVSGTASANLPLAIGANVFDIVVTATDGISTKTYQLTVNRSAPVYATEASLSSLTTTNATFFPAFNSNTLNYSASVAGTVAGLTVTPSSLESHAVIEVEGTPLVSGTESGTIALNYGSNTIHIKVTAEDGVTVKTYALTVIRQASANADLSGITLSTGHLTPNFSANGLTYSAEVPGNVDAITLTPYTAEATATVRVEGTIVASGAASGTFPLAVGPNVITAAVTAQDNVTVKNYQITVVRAPSSNANLSALTPSSGTLSPTFDPAKTSYGTSVPNTVTSINITPVSGGVNEIITVDGVVVASGTASTAIPLIVGNNPITVQVTAEDGITIKNYLLTVSRLPSSDAGLAGLATNQGDLLPTFATGIASYSIAVSNATTAIKIIPTVNEPNATVTVNNVSVGNGSASGNISLNIGVTNIMIKVTAQDGVSTQTYSVSVTRAASSNADLANLEINPGSLTEVFDPGITAYSAKVGNTTTAVKLTPALSEANASVAINGVPVASGVPSGNIALNVGPNIINVKVTAQDGITVKNYTVTVTREPSSNADLSNIALSTGSLKEVFASGKLDYSADVLNTDASIQIKATVSDATATITVNGDAVAAGSFSGNIPLTVGQTVITIVATAQDGITTKTYTVTVKRPPSADANLAALVPGAGKLDPLFTQGTTAYTVTVPNTVTAITLSPTVNEANASVKVNGTIVASGTASNSFPLIVGASVFTTVVTAQDGVTTKTYTVTVIRQKSTDATLSNITLTDGSTLTPNFLPGITTYTASVLNTVTTASVIPVANESNAIITIGGRVVNSGAASAPVTLVVGPNTINTIVTAQDGVTTQTYSITVIRMPSTDATLSDLKLSSKTLTPAISSGSLLYNASVGNEVKTITFTPIVNQADATVKINGVSVTSGSPSAAIPLKVGDNTITTVVTAQDGITTKSYIATINRAPSTNATLAQLAVVPNQLNITFNKLITGYSMLLKNDVTSAIVTPTVEDATATVVINGIPVASGSPSPAIPLKVGNNPITIIVTAEDGKTKKTYVIIANRALSSDNDLANLVLSSGTLKPGFESGLNNYTAAVAHAVNSVNVKPYLADAAASVKVNGVAVSSGSASPEIRLNVGPNMINVVVTAQNSEVNTYTITVNRDPGSNANLLNLSLSAGTLSPAFTIGKTSYAATVLNAVGSVKITPTVEDATATVKVNGTAVASGSASQSIVLTVGSNTILTTVTAQDGITTQTYSVTITRAKSPNADLGTLTLSSGSLSPVFSAAGTSYSVTVNNSEQTIRVTPTAVDAAAVVRVNNAIVAAGGSSGNIPLAVGITPVNITVTAEDGTLKTYTVNVTRSKSPDASLADLTSASGVLDPAFSPAVLAYQITVDNSIATATLKPTANDAGATIQVNGQAVVSGNVSQALTLKQGANPFNVKVTAADGTIQTYVVNIFRTLSDNADLANLVLSAGNFTPAFTSGNLNYELHVPYNVFKTTVTATASDPGAGLKINGSAAQNGIASGSVTINSASTLVTVTVTSASGAQSKSYQVKVIRAAPPVSTDATLISLRTSSGQLSPSFSPTTTNYVVTVDANTQSVTVTGITTNGGATIKINGTEVLSGSSSDEIILAPGTNPVIPIVVTAADGVTTQTYTVAISKAVLAAILPSVVTPNGDGVNDYWVIPNINLFPDCTVKIFNRGGQMIFSSVGYGTPWDGTLNGRTLQADVYYYVIDLKHSQGVRSGAVTIMK